MRHLSLSPFLLLIARDFNDRFSATYSSSATVSRCGTEGAVAVSSSDGLGVAEEAEESLSPSRLIVDRQGVRLFVLFVVKIVGGMGYFTLFGGTIP